MSKRRKRAALLCLAVSMGFLLAGCGAVNQPISTDGTHTGQPIQPELVEIRMPFALAKDGETGRAANMYTVCYSGADCLLVADVNDDITTATETIRPEIRTNGLYRVDYDADAEPVFYNLVSDGLIYCAVPYAEGIVYVESKPQGGEANYAWSVVYFDGQSKVPIDGGLCQDQLTTQLTLVGDTPEYLCQRNGEQGDTGIAVCKIVGQQTQELDFLPGVINRNMLDGNGTTYLLNLYDAAQEQVLLAAGDAEGIRTRYQLTDKLNSCSISQRHVVASVGEELGQRNIEGLPLNGGENRVLFPAKRLWRITGAEGTYCVAVDDKFAPYYIHAEKEIIGEIRLPDEVGPSTVVKTFYPAGKDRFLLSVDYERFYLLELQEPE